MTDMRCRYCGGRVEWQGPLINLTHTVCLECGAPNSQAMEDVTLDDHTEETDHD